MKGYKVFNPDWTCMGFQYEVGKTYETDKSVKLCAQGFHFCKKAADCFNYYSFDSNNKVAEVVAHGDVVEGGDKSVTNKIEIVREIEWHELLEIVNMGKNNTGRCNTGHRNTGDSNTGNWNTGDSNTGNWNTGDSNTGDWNTGDWNTGDSNTGDWNTGDWNKTDYSSGLFCTEEQPLLIFDKQSDWDRNKWLKSDARDILYYMPNDDRQKWWDNLGEDCKNVIKALPNFNATKFEYITGIKLGEGE